MVVAERQSGATATSATRSWTTPQISFVIARGPGSLQFKLTSNLGPSKTPSTSFVPDCKSVLTKSFFASTLLAEYLVFWIQGAGLAALEVHWTLKQQHLEASVGEKSPSK